jgi:DNA-binding SARP family transcriptional activator
VKHTSVRGACQRLIAYLALRPGGATRDELIEAIWPDQDSRSTNTRHHLYQNVSQARSVLGDALIAGRAHYALDRHKVAVDVDELDQTFAELNSIDDPKAQRPTLERAGRLFRGEPLAGWNQEWTEADVGSGGLHWLRRGGLKWPHFASVVVCVDLLCL